jgi:hypothetical protein
MCLHERHAGRPAQQEVQRCRNIGIRAGGNKQPGQLRDGMIDDTVAAIIVGIIGLEDF